MSIFQQAREFFRENATGSVVLGVGAAGLLGLALLQGCSLGDAIKVAVPEQIQKTTGVGPKVSLNKAPFAREEFVQDASRALAEFDDSIERADALRNIFADFLNSGLTIGQDALAGSGFPLGGALALALGGVGGLFIQKPGSQRKTNVAVQVARDEGYDQGRQEARRDLSDFVSGRVAPVSSSPIV